ncbi:dihydrolipoyl dehydrogenase family protein [Thiomicrolovo sp. ZZH C-3]
MKTYDTVVIGAGPGGYEAALELGRAGIATLLIEEQKVRIGGTCLNEGCIPAKQYLEAADFASKAAFFRELDVVETTTALALGRLKAKTVALRDEIRSGMVWMLDRAGVELMYGRAAFTDAHTLEVDGEPVAFEHCIIATGSEVRQIPALPADGKRIITSREVFDLERLPASVAIVGGGPIACEFATFFSAFGTDVTLIIRGTQLLSAEDEDVSKALMRAFRQRGITIITGAAPEKAEADGTGVQLHLGGQEPLACDLVLSAIGRTPRTGTLMLENAGVNCDGKGFIDVNPMFRSSAPHIYAVGDCIATQADAHTASAEGRIAAKNIAGSTLNNQHLSPSATFSEPAVARCGMTERKALEQGRDVVIKKAYFKANAKAKIMGNDAGFAKLVVDAATGTILGAAIVGIGAAEVIHLPAMAVELERTADELKSMIRIHPTLSEIVTAL